MMLLGLLCTIRFPRLVNYAIVVLIHAFKCTRDPVHKVRREKYRVYIIAAQWAWRKFLSSHGGNRAYNARDAFRVVRS